METHPRESLLIKRAALMPNSTDTARHYFYQNGRVSVVSEAEILYTLFCSEHLPLATVQCDANADLLMIDDKHSVLAGTLKKAHAVIRSMATSRTVVQMSICWGSMVNCAWMLGATRWATDIVPTIQR